MAYTDPSTILASNVDGETSDHLWGQALADGLDEMWQALVQPWKYWDFAYSRLGSTDGVALRQQYWQQIGHECMATASFEVLDGGLLVSAAGAHRFDFPSAPAILADHQLVGAGALFDSSTGQWHRVQALFDGDLKSGILLSDAGPVTDSVPFTLTTGDKGVLNLHYRLMSKAGVNELTRFPGVASVSTAFSRGLETMRSAASWYDSKTIVTSGQQTLPNRGTGPSVSAQRGSTAGSDTNDPVFLPHTGEDYVWFPGNANNRMFQDVVGAVPAGDVVSTVGRKELGVRGDFSRIVASGVSARFYCSTSASSVVVTYTEDGATTARVSTIPLGGADLAVWVNVEMDMVNDRIRARKSESTTYDPGQVVWGSWSSWVSTDFPVKALVGSPVVATVYGSLTDPYGSSYVSWSVDGVEITSWTPEAADEWTYRSLSTQLKTTVVTRPVPVFDGVDDYLQLPASDTPTFTATTGKHTVVVASRCHNIAYTGRLYSSDFAANRGLGLFQENGGHLLVRVGGSDAFVDIRRFSAFAVGTLTVSAAVVDEGSVSAYTNTTGLSGSSSISGVGSLVHGTPRVGTGGWTVTSSLQDQVFSVLSFPGEALTEAELDELSARLIAGDYT